MKHINCAFGLGDTWLVCALAHALPGVTVHVKPDHAPIAEMFGLAYETSPGGITVHPSTMSGGNALDALTAREGFSQADMYRLLLDLPLDTPLARPTLKWHSSAPRGVVIMPHARSMPTRPLWFWRDLAERLSRTMPVYWNSPEACAGTTRFYGHIGELYALIEAAGWVIGPNTGGFVCAVASELKAHKTLIAHVPEEPFRFNAHVTLKGAFPFSHQRKFCGRDYDVDEIGPDDVIEIPEGEPNTRPSPILRAPMSLGDILDRLTILDLKLEANPSRHIKRERQEILDTLQEAGIGQADTEPQLTALRAANRAGFEIGDRLYAQTNEQTPEATALHIAMMRTNKDRVKAKQAINAKTGSLLTEAKTYSLQ